MTPERRSRSDRTPHRWPRSGRSPRLETTLAAALTAAALLLAPTAAWAEGDDDPNLDQTIQEDQPIVHGERVLTAGHVDMGPRFDDGTWTFLIHDDVAKADANAESVWRYPEETVFHVLDQARLPVPDDPAYAFVGAEPGADVWVVPQTQNPEVVWVGWNTQDPEVMATIDRGVTLSLTGVQGPGVVTTYLQSGTFGEPQLLWDSRIAEPQPVWVDVNTHTHANWVFTEPGVYLLRLEASADLVDGSSVTDTQLIRFAVGTDTDPADALAAAWEGAAADDPAPDEEAPPAADEPVDAAPQPATDPIVPILIGAIVLVLIALVIGFSIAIVRGNRAKRRVLDARAGDDAGAPE